MDVHDARIGDVVYFVADDYDEQYHINVSILQKGTITAIYEDTESIEVEWANNLTGEDEEQADDFFFATKQEAIADYIGRHTDDLVAQALTLD